MTMRAAVFERFGGPEVLEVREVERPEPRPGEVLIRVRATTVTAAESAMRRGEPLWGRILIGFFRPRRRFRTLGTELAGEVAAVGRGVTRWREGDAVYGFAGFDIGANADFMVLPEDASLALKPQNLSFEDAAAAVDGPTTALFFLRDRARLRPGQRVLVIGASGSVGSYAVQLAKHLGAEVTGVCSGRNVELVRSLGADDVIDYTREDYARTGRTWDVIFDTVGASSFGHAQPALSSRGAFLPTAIDPINALQSLYTPWLGGKRVVGGMSVHKHDALVYVRDLLEREALRVVVDRRFALEDIVEAHRLVDTGRKRGNVPIRV